MPAPRDRGAIPLTSVTERGSRRGVHDGDDSEHGALQHVDDVVGGLREVIDAGAQTILLNPVGRDVGQDREQMERLAAEVIPQLD